NESEVMLYNLIITDFVSDYGDSGGSAFSFVSPQDLHSVVVNGVFSIIGAAIQPIDKIFKELDERDRYYELYLGKWW
ncbi:26310_t:CDS:1, partial [Gigaspora rosea]